MSTSIPKDGLRAIFATLSGHAADRIIWSGESLPFAGKHKVTGKTGMLVLDVIARRRIGVDEELRDYPDDDTTRITRVGHRRVTLQLRAEEYDDDEGFDVLEEISLELGSDSMGEALNALGLGFEGAGDVRPISMTKDNRDVSFATVDVFFNQSVEKVTDKATSTGDTYINKVEIAGEDDDMSRVTTFEVDGS